MALQPGDKYYSGLALNFGQTLSNWAFQSAVQLQDAFRMQRVWDGTKSNSVWFKSGKKRYWTGERTTKKVGKNKDRSVKVKKMYTASGWSWYDEVSLRSIMQRKFPAHDYWYSTGLSYATAMNNPVQVVNGNMEFAEVAFNTTMGALFAEAGVGLTGQKFTRGARGSKGRKRIKVNRSENWHYDKRYAQTWRPMTGDTHRPNVRQQASLLARRLRWAARMVYERDLTAYLGYMLQENFDELGEFQWKVTETGLTVGVRAILRRDANGKAIYDKTIRTFDEVFNK